MSECSNQIEKLAGATEKKRVALHTLGCRLNFSETGSIADGFAKRGFELVPFGEQADVVFLNTCTVTDGADSTCRNLIRRAQKSAPEARIVVAGCYAQMEAEKLKSMPGVDLVLGTSEKYKVFDYLQDEERQLIAIDKTNEFWGAATTLAESRTRAFLKIQDGCNYICSYCIIPFARGRSRVIEIADAVKEAQKLVAQGFKEIVLTGVNIGEYESTSGQRLTELIKRILDLPGLERLRLSSVEPNTITRELVELLASSEKFMDHFHIPLQSGDDEILKRMKRKYSVSQYRETLSLVKEFFPNAGIGADVIVGFPGESAEQFQNTVSFLESEPVTHFHVFPFSKRQKTLAARMPEQIPQDLKKRRVSELLRLGERKLSAFSKAQIGTRSRVLFERSKRPGFIEGYSSHFLKVEVPISGELNENSVHEVELFSFEEGRLQGRPVKSLDANSALVKSC